jgi:hypothetical protein
VTGAADYARLYRSASAAFASSSVSASPLFSGGATEKPSPLLRAARDAIEVDAVNERAFHDSIIVLAPGAGWPTFDGVVGTHQGRSSSSLGLGLAIDRHQC